MEDAVISKPKHAKRKSKRSQLNVCDSLMRYAEYLGYGELHIKIDEETGLRAIVAINNLKRGPAIGGCRMLHYSTIAKAIEDVLRLGYMMSYKAAINNLAHGGGKSVIIKPKVIKDRDAFFAKFAEFVHSLGGRYITAVDSGTSPVEMDIISRHTPYVTCTTKLGGDSDPSPLTALGVRRAIEAGVKFKLGRESLDGVRVAVQGVGHVGYFLAKEIHERGGRLIVADVNIAALQRCVEQFNAEVVDPEDIYDVEADVFAPCALGSILNLDTIQRLRVQVVAGSANNQLAHHHYGNLLKDRGILYAPDFLINSGGLIHVAVLYDHGNIKQSLDQINNIYHTVYEIYERAAAENKATSDIAEQIARERLS